MTRSEAKKHASLKVTKHFYDHVSTCFVKISRCPQAERSLMLMPRPPPARRQSTGQRIGRPQRVAVRRATINVTRQQRVQPVLPVVPEEPMMPEDLFVPDEPVVRDEPFVPIEPVAPEEPVVQPKLTKRRLSVTPFSRESVVPVESVDQPKLKKRRLSVTPFSRKGRKPSTGNYVFVVSFKFKNAFIQIS